MGHSCRKTTVSSRNLDDGLVYVRGVADGTAVAGANICTWFNSQTVSTNPFILAALWGVTFDGADRIRLPCILGVN